MSRFPGKLTGLFALVLIVSNSQCIASCSFESCKKVSTPETSVPPCHRQGKAPAHSSAAPCSADTVVADVDQSTITKFSTNPGPLASLSAIPTPASALVALSFAGKVSLVPSPPEQTLLSSTVLRIWIAHQHAPEVGLEKPADQTLTFRFKGPRHRAARK